MRYMGSVIVFSLLVNNYDDGNYALVCDVVFTQLSHLPKFGVR